MVKLKYALRTVMVRDDPNRLGPDWVASIIGNTPGEAYFSYTRLQDHAKLWETAEEAVAAVQSRYGSNRVPAGDEGSFVLVPFLVPVETARMAI